jgi:predicted alpha/beta superfamily hydrolase
VTTIHDFPSDVLGNTRTLRILLPEGTGPFPVVYAHDGQNLFDPNAFWGGWGLDQATEELSTAGIKFIIVGIDNNAARMSEYTPVFAPGYGGGDGDVYLDFVAEEVKPYIDFNFPTRCGRTQTAIMGSSLGGLISFHAARTRSDVFGMAAALSPSFWWNNGWTYAQYATQPHRNPVRLWIDSGTDEGGDEGPACSSHGECDAYCDDTGGCRYRTRSVTYNAREIVHRALELGHTFGVDLGYAEDERMVHNEAAWRHRAKSVLLFFFGPPNPVPLSAYVFFSRNPIHSGSATSAVLQTAFSDGRRLTVPPELVTWDVTMPGVSITADRVSSTTLGDAVLTGRFGDITGSGTLVTLDNPAALTEVVFEVHAPADTPPGDSLFVSGNADALGSWAPGGVALQRLHGNLWRASFLLPASQPVEFKYTRGDWETVEVASSGADVDNRSDAVDAPHLRADWIARWHEPL